MSTYIWSLLKLIIIKQTALCSRQASLGADRHQFTNIYSSLSRLFLKGWRNVRGDIQVKYSPCFAMAETWTLPKKQAASHRLALAPPTPPHSTAPPQVTVMDTFGKNLLLCPGASAQNRQASLGELYWSLCKFPSHWLKPVPQWKPKESTVKLPYRKL